MGGADAGVYVNLSAAIARTGQLLHQNAALAQLPEALYPAFMRATPAWDAAPFVWLPGYYFTAAQPGQLTPQFYHLHPVWMAAAFSLGGLRAALLITPLWAVLGSLAVYATARRLWGWPFAAVVLAGLTLNALQLWFARYPTTEMLTQFFFWVGIWGFTAWAETGWRDGRWGLLAGMAWGSTFLVRIDSFFIWAVPILLFVWLASQRRLQREQLWFFGPLLILPAHSAAHGLLFSRPYFFNTFGVLGRFFSEAIPLLVGGVVLGLVGFFVVLRWQRTLQRFLSKHSAALRASAVALALLLAFYGWFVRPALASSNGVWVDWFSGAPISNYEPWNLLRFAWYLSPLGIWLAVFGAALLIWRANRRTWALLLVGGLFSLFYMWQMWINQHHIYAMRRLVPVVMPFFVVAAVYALAWLYGRRQLWTKAAALVLMLLWLGGFAWLARGLVFQQDYLGITAQLDALAAEFPPNAVIIFNDNAPAVAPTGDALGTPLAMLYGHDVFVTRDFAEVDAALLAQTIEVWQANGRAVYWVSVPNGHDWPLDAPLGEPSGRFDITSAHLEANYEARPTQLVHPRWEGEIYKIQELGIRN